MWLTGAGRRGEYGLGGDCLMGIVSFLQHERFLEIGCAMCECTYLTLLNCNFKMVKMVNSCCVFYHN